MRIRLIVARLAGDTSISPWVLSAWDEWTIDEFGEADFEDDVQKYRENSPSTEIRVAVVNVPDDFLANVFKPVEVNGVVEG